jgi:hypothetical protein
MVRSMVLLALMLVSSTSAVHAETRSADEPLAAFLARWAGVSPAERRDVESGRVVARTLDVTDQKDVAGLAVVKIGVPKTFLLDWLRNPEASGGESVLAAGEIGDPPRAQDVEGLRFDAGQFDEVRNCRIGDCAIKLPPSEIARIEREASGRLAAADAADLLRRLLLETAAGYRRAGDAGLGVYADSPQRVEVRDAVQRLLATPPHVLAGIADLARRVAEDPFALGGRLVWTKERLWKRTVVSLDHQFVLEPSAAEGVVVSKRLFASHYFEAAFSVAAVHETAGACYLVFLNRSRSDVSGKGFSGLERALVNMLVRRRLRGQWQDVRTRAESAYRVQVSGGAAPRAVAAASSGR